MNDKDKTNYKDLYIKELEVKIQFLQDIANQYIQTLPLDERIKMEKDYLEKVYKATGIASEFGKFFYPEIYKSKYNADHTYDDLFTI